MAGTETQPTSPVPVGPTSFTAVPAANPGFVVVTVASPEKAPSGGVETGNAARYGEFVWPLVLLILALIFRRQISDLATGRGGQRIKSVSFAGFSLELADTVAAVPMYAARTDIDIRHAGTAQDVNDSTLRSFYDQISSRERTPYTVVDLGTGAEWLTSRLFVLAAIMRRMRGVEVVVFVENHDGESRRFIGLGPIEALRWRLASWYPLLEAALAAGEIRAWYGPPGAAVSVPPSAVPLQEIDNDDGRFTNAEGAAELLRGFLDKIQRPAPPPDAPREWQLLQTAPGQPVRYEYARWLTRELVERIFSGVLETESIELRDFEGLDEPGRAHLIASSAGDWLAVTRNGQLHGLIDRRKALEGLARGATRGLSDR
jgi:hypothetical protein